MGCASNTGMGCASDPMGGIPPSVGVGGRPASTGGGGIPPSGGGGTPPSPDPGGPLGGGGGKPPSGSGEQTTFVRSSFLRASSFNVRVCPVVWSNAVVPVKNGDSVASKPGDRGVICKN